jgi:IS4 transposase
MPTHSIVPAGQNSTTISSDLASVGLNSIRQMLPDAAIVKACRDGGYVFRRRLITPVVIVLHMVLSAIWPEESFTASWQAFWSTFKSRFPQSAAAEPSRGTVANARNRLPLKVWHNIFAWLSQQAQTLSERWSRWRGHRVVLLDGTCVSMADNPELLAAFGTQNGARGKARYPLARIVALSLANTMTVISYAIGGYRQDETVLAAAILHTLQKGDLLIADRHFAGANFYVRYQRMGLEYLTRVHQRVKLSRIKRLRTYNRGDFIGRLKVGALYRRKDPTLPKWTVVRFIRATFSTRGRTETLWLVTSLLDAESYPAAEIIQLYARRWRIETLFKELKVNMSADVLRSLTADGIRKEIAARLTAVNVVRSIILQAADQNDVDDPLRISFVFALRAILNFAPALAIEPAWKLPLIYAAMLREIAAHKVRYRPGRNEPRAVRREQKHYPRLTITRAQWRTGYAA